MRPKSLATRMSQLSMSWSLEDDLEPQIAGTNLAASAKRCFDMRDMPSWSACWMIWPPGLKTTTKAFVYKGKAKDNQDGH